MQSQGHPQGPLQGMYWKGIPQMQSPRHPLGPLQGMLNLGMGIMLAGVRVMPREQLQEQFSYECLSDAFRYHASLVLGQSERHNRRDIIIATSAWFFLFFFAE